MSGVSIIRWLLANNVPVQAVIPATRIMAGVLPLNTVMPAIAVTQAYPALVGKFDGISIRVPTPAGSIADITFIAKRDTTVEEVNDILRKAAALPRWQGLFTATDEELVSHDIVGDTHGSIADLTMTRVVGGNLVKVLAWYDNETSYTSTLVEHVRQVGLLLEE